MRARGVIVLCVAGACGADPDPPPPDPCEVPATAPGRASELGFGDVFTPIANGQEITIVLGAQGLWMFVVNVRAPETDFQAGETAGIIADVKVDPTGEVISLLSGCRVREFVPMGDGFLQLESPYFLPLQPSFTPRLEGARVAIDLEVRDAEGRSTRDRRSIVVRKPTALR